MKKILILLLISGFPFYSARACESVLELGPYQAGHQTWILEDTSRGVAPYKNLDLNRQFQNKVFDYMLKSTLSYLERLLSLLADFCSKSQVHLCSSHSILY